MIPKRFSILGQEIKVRRVKVIPYKEHKNDRGLWVPAKNLIYICIDENKDIEWQTLEHEKFHAILDLTGYENLSLDERFVELVSGAIYQTSKTAEY